jgi:hypothetical protein
MPIGVHGRRISAIDWQRMWQHCEQFNLDNGRTHTHRCRSIYRMTTNKTSKERQSESERERYETRWWWLTTTRSVSQRLEKRQRSRNWQQYTSRCVVSKVNTIMPIERIIKRERETEEVNSTTSYPPSKIMVISIVFDNDEFSLSSRYYYYCCCCFSVCIHRNNKCLTSDTHSIEIDVYIDILDRRKRASALAQTKQRERERERDRKKE